MVILTGIICLIFLCGSILILSSFPISLHEKKGIIKSRADKNDVYNYLFDVYGD
jgi:hypothetical protein